MFILVVFLVTLQVHVQVYGNEVEDNGKIAKITTIIDPPFVMTNENSEKLEGFFVDMLDAMAEAGGFEYQLSLVADGKYGSTVPGNRNYFTGMIGELMDGKADVAVARLSVTPFREAVVKFGVPIDVNAGLLMQRRYKADGSPFSSYDDVLEDANVKVIAVFYGNTMERLYAARDERAQRLMEKLDMDMSMDSESEGIARVLASPNTAFLMETATAQYVASRSCNLEVIQTHLQLHDQAWAYPNKSEWRDKFNALFKKFPRADIYRKWWAGGCDVQNAH